MKTIKTLGLSLIITTLALTANAQKFGKTPEDSIKCIENVSLYSESYKQGNYVDAYGPWKEVLKYCPENSKNVYVRGANILKNLIANAKTKEEQTKYVDELMHMYDLRIKYFGEEAENKARKALDMEALKGTSAVDQYYKLLEDAVKIGGDELDPTFIYKFFEATIYYVHAGKAEPTLIIDNYDIATTLLEKELKKNPARKAEIQGFITNVEAAFSPYASCDQLVSIFEKKFNEKPNDLELVKKICTLLESKGCANTDLFFNATEKLHAMEPGARSAYLMGSLCLGKEQYGKAIEYLQEAVKKLDDEKIKYQAYIRLAYAYNAQRSFSAARSAAYDAAKLDPSKGEPYMIIANLYAQSAGSCCGNGPVLSRVAFWAAVDKAARAKAVEDTPEMIERANKFINTYSRHFPSQAEAFMEDVIDGQSYTVGGWIGETTTVRTNK